MTESRCSTGSAALADRIEKSLVVSLMEQEKASAGSGAFGGPIWAMPLNDDQKALIVATLRGVAQPQQFPCPECDNETACLNRASCAAPPAQPVPGGDKGEAVASPTRDAIAKALANHFKTTIEKHRGMPFPETGVFLPNESFDGYADAVLLLYATPQPASNAGGETVTDAMVDRAMGRFQAAVNSMVMCPRCNGVGHHHGFGEDGHDPDWCEKCGGCQSVNEFEDREAMREALKAALGSFNPAYAQPKWRHLKRGSIVTEIARGFAQVAHHPIEEMTCVVIYRHDDGRYWVRNAVEFDDGRFEAYPVSSTEHESGCQSGDFGPCDCSLSSTTSGSAAK